MKKIIDKLVAALRAIFGYGILIGLFVGGFTFFGFVVALIIGGDTGALVCRFIQKDIFPILIYGTSVMVLLGLVVMYLSGETALTVQAKKEKAKKR